MPGVINIVDTSALATSAKQDVEHADLTAILAKLSADPATQTTLAAVLAKLIAAPSTEAKQDVGNAVLASILAKLIAAPATEAKQDTGNASLASIDGKTTVCNTGAVTVASCALPTGAATAAAQATGNASLSSLDGKVTTCNTGAVVLATGAATIGKVDQGTGGASAWKVDGSAVTQPVSAMSLPLPSGAATEAKQDTGNTSAATTATQTTTTATNTGTIAGAVLAPDTALSGGVSQIGGVGSASAPTSVTDGRSVRAWLTRFGATMVGLLGANGTALASSSNGVPVVAQTSSTWDVADRAARLLGALTGVNGSGVATLANPVPAQLSDGSAGYTGAKTGQLPTSLGVQASSGVLCVVRSIASIDQQTTLATAGKVIKSGPGVAIGLTSYFNNTGGAVFFQVFNSTSLPSSGERPAYFSASIASGTKSSIGFGITALGIGCPTGIVFALSSTQDTFTAIASTAFIYALQYD